MGIIAEHLIEARTTLGPPAVFDASTSEVSRPEPEKPKAEPQRLQPQKPAEGELLLNAFSEAVSRYAARTARRLSAPTEATA